jgi:hypothetical protein
MEWVDIGEKRDERAAQLQLTTPRRFASRMNLAYGLSTKSLPREGLERANEGRLRIGARDLLSQRAKRLQKDIISALYYRAKKASFGLCHSNLIG